MRWYKFFLPISLFFFITMLTSCDDGKQKSAHQDVARWVKQIETASQTPKKEKSQLTVVKAVTYQAQNLRDPFELPLAVKNKKYYPNTILRSAALDSLKLVGIVVRDGQRWAIFRANDGKVYKMTEGMRVGIQQALLTQIAQNQVKFMVDVDTPEGEKKREMIIPMQEPAE